MQLAKLTCAHMCSHVLTCAHMYIAQDTNVQPGRKIVRQLTGVDSSPGAEVSFSAGTDTAPRRRVQRKQTGIWESQGAVSPPAHVSAPVGGVRFAQDTNVQPGRKIVRQLTGVDSSPGAEVSFSAVDQTQSGCLQERGNVVAAELTYLRAAVQSVASVAH
jgi:hypothetical protein